jgi:hypothetical protein
MVRGFRFLYRLWVGGWFPFAAERNPLSPASVEIAKRFLFMSNSPAVDAAMLRFAATGNPMAGLYSPQLNRIGYKP